MSKIDNLLKDLTSDLPYFQNHAEDEKCRQIIKKHFEIVHNEAVTATIIAENRKNSQKSSQPPIYKD
jgi:hypothetical protein